MTAPVTQRGRPRSQAKREKIFEAAGELFPEQGYENVTMDMVAERAGVSKQTVYSHFRSKEELFAAIISAKCIGNQLSGEFMDPARPVGEMLREIGRRFLTLLLSDGAIHIYRLSLASAAQHPDIARLYYQAGPRYAIGAVADYLAGQHQRGTLVIDDPWQAACQFLFMLKADAVMRVSLNIDTEADPEELERYLDSCVGVFLRAYGSR